MSVGKWILHFLFFSQIITQCILHVFYTFGSTIRKPSSALSFSVWILLFWMHTQNICSYVKNTSWRTDERTRMHIAAEQMCFKDAEKSVLYSSLEMLDFCLKCLNVRKAGNTLSKLSYCMRLKWKKKKRNQSDSSLLRAVTHLNVSHLLHLIQRLSIAYCTEEMHSYSPT